MNSQAFAEIISDNQNLKRISELIETELCSIGSPPGMRYDSIRVQSTPENRLERGVVKVEMLRERAAKIKARIDAKKAQIEAFQIDTHIFTDDEWRVVKCRYFEGYSYHRTEEETGFSFRKVRRLIGKISKKIFS